MIKLINTPPYYEIVPTPPIPTGGGDYKRLNARYDEVTTVGTTETDLYEYEIPANTLINNGDTLEIHYTFTITGATDDHITRLYFNNILEWAPNHNNGDQFTYKAQIMKDSTNTAKFTMQPWGFGALGSPQLETQISLDFTQEIPIKFTGQCTGTATIKTFSLTIDKVNQVL